MGNHPRPKRLENRSWKTSYRGPLVIHASGSRASDPDAQKLFAKLGLKVPDEFPRGVLLGQVDLVDIYELTDKATPPWVRKDPFAVGEYCWHLANPRPLKKPVPYAGRLQLFEVPNRLVKTADTR